MDAVQLTAIVGAVASLLYTLVVGALTYFLKHLLGTLGEADEKNAERIEAVNKEKTAQIKKIKEKLNDLKAGLPFLYVAREDYIRVMNRVEDKLDQILYGSNKGKEG